MTDLVAELDTARETLQHSRLNSIRLLATGLFVAATVLFGVAHFLSRSQPAWGYVAAFAEAAMVGALADWFAVVALFRHPLGIPLPHTAIIPNSKDEIGRNLGAFVENHFITETAILQRLRSADPAKLLTGWFMRPENGAALGRFLTKGATVLLQNADDRRLSTLLGDTARQQLLQLDISSAAGQMTSALVKERKHQELLNEIVKGLHAYLQQEENQPQVVSFMVKLFNADNAFVRTALQAAAPRASKSLVETLGQVLADQDHAWRLQFDKWVADFVLHLKADPEWQDAIERQQRAALDSVQVQSLLEGLWGKIKSRLQDDLTRDDPEIAQGLAALTLHLGQTLGEDATLREWLNRTIETGVAELIRRYRGEVGKFIEHQLEKWTQAEMSDRIELAIGRDLQFIRINGTLVGGLVGLIIYAVTRAV